MSLRLTQLFRLIGYISVICGVGRVYNSDRLVIKLIGEPAPRVIGKYRMKFMVKYAMKIRDRQTLNKINSP